MYVYVPICVYILDILYSVCNTMYIVYVYFLLHILILLFAVWVCLIICQFVTHIC